MSTHTELGGELKAMAQVEAALSTLSDDEKDRVLRWAAERFGVKGYKRERPSNLKERRDTSDGAEDCLHDHADLAEFFAAAHPEGEVDKALVAGYWIQYREGHGEFEAQMINSELKHLGHRVGNITRAFGNLMARKPQLVVQTRKSGSSKQARKKYKLTAAGKKAVEKMLSGARDDD